MERFNTGNPVPSVDPRDRSDNTQIFDQYVTGTEEVVYDRLNQPRFALQAFHNLVLNAKLQIGPVVDQAKGAVTSARDKGISDIQDSVNEVDAAADAAEAQMLKTAAALGDDLNNKRYATDAAMRADPQTRDAVVGLVDADPDPRLNGWNYWNNTTKTWVRFVDQPVNSAMFKTVSDLIKLDPGQEISHSFEDANRFILGWITRARMLVMKGGLDVGAAQLLEGPEGLQVTDGQGFSIAQLGAAKSSLSGLSVERVGANAASLNGLVLSGSDAPGIEVTDENRFILGKFNGQPSAVLPLPPSPALRLGAQVRTAIMHLVVYGQSLSRGQNATPAISTSQDYGNVMLASGVKTREGEAGYNASSLVPLVEQTVSNEGETPATGMCNGITRRAVADGEQAADWRFLATAPGRGGRSVEQLMPSENGAADFNKMVREIRDCKALADSLGNSYSVWGYAWIQGETNYLDPWTHSPYLYMQYMLGLFDTLTAQVASITGQLFQPYIFTYQVGAHRKYNLDNMSIALSQWRASRERPDVVMAVPVYIFPTGSDSLHLTNEASWLLGEYQGRAAYQTMVRRNGKWRPLEPVSLDWQDDHIDIKFHVPSGNLVLDTALAAGAPNFGFDIRDADTLLSDIISSVTLIGKDVVRLGLSRPAPSNAVVSYARGRNGDPAASGPAAGARGNLRDTHGLFDTATSPLGNTFALHNPCVMFQYNRKTGF